MFREWSYVVEVVNQQGHQTSPSDLAARLFDITQDALREEQKGNVPIPIGRLTADHRDLWAMVMFIYASNAPVV